MKRVVRKGHSGKKHFAATAMLVVAIVLSGTLLILVYGTQTLTWQEIFSYLELSHSSQDYESNNSQEALVQGQEPNTTAINGDAVVVTIIDVGQGDSILIQTPSINVLIDGGDVFAGDEICNLLKQKGITRLEYVFATHPHVDHIGGMVDVLAQFDIGRLTFTNVPPELTPTNATYFELLTTINNKNIDTWIASSDEEFKLDKGTLKIWSAGGYDNLNDCSLVLRYEYDRTSFLFMGDAGFKTENDFIAEKVPKSDVLKAGHHGSKYSTSDKFLKAVNPKFVVASCGVNNQYGYPTESFMSRVEKQDSELLRTDTNGDIVFISDGINIRLEEPNKKAA